MACRRFPNKDGVSSRGVYSNAVPDNLDNLALSLRVVSKTAWPGVLYLIV